MTEIREEIDRVDRSIVPLLVERLGYIKQAGHTKKDRGTVRDDWRIEDVIAKILSTTRDCEGDQRMAEDIYRFIIEWSISHEFDVYDDIINDKNKSQ